MSISARNNDETPNLATITLTSGLSRWPDNYERIAFMYTKVS